MADSRSCPQPEDVHCVRNLLNSCGSRGSRIKIISKIENREGLDNFDSILSQSDSTILQAPLLLFCYLMALWCNG